MNTQEILIVLSSLLSLFGIGYLMVQSRLLCMEFFKQDLFILRDKVFDYARTGNIGFTDPAYIMLRHTMNGWIRFAHQRTMWHGLVLFILLSREDKERIMGTRFDVRWSKAVANMDGPVREQLDSYRERMHKLTFRYFLISAPEVVVGVSIVFMFIFVTLTLYRQQTKLRSIVENWFKKTDDAALLYGEEVVA